LGRVSRGSRLRWRDLFDLWLCGTKKRTSPIVRSTHLFFFCCCGIHHFIPSADLKATFQLQILGVKKNPQSPMYTQLGVLTKGTIIEVNVSELGMVTAGGKVVFGKYAQVTNNPENDGCINAVLRASYPPLMFRRTPLTTSSQLSEFSLCPSYTLFSYYAIVSVNLNVAALRARVHTVATQSQFTNHETCFSPPSPRI